MKESYYNYSITKIEKAFYFNDSIENKEFCKVSYLNLTDVILNYCIINEI